MKIEKVTIGEIRPGFEIRVFVDLGQGRSRGERFSFRGLEMPALKSKKGRAICKHVMNAAKGVEFFAVKRYGKNPFVRWDADFFYLPGETDPEKIVRRGRCLNQDILEMKLAGPYDEKKHQIDFSKEMIKMFDKELYLVSGNFKAEVCMYINDCKQYLRAAIEHKPVDMMKGEFDPTDEEFLIIYGLKELKDMSMQAAGRARLEWRGN